jgi:hypothetical protein
MMAIRERHWVSEGRHDNERPDTLEVFLHSHMCRTTVGTNKVLDSPVLEARLACLLLPAP